jgi:hypothetical protein
LIKRAWDIQRIAQNGFDFEAMHEFKLCCVFCAPNRTRGAVMEKEFFSMDIVVLGLGILFLILSLAYTKACDNL